MHILNAAEQLECCLHSLYYSPYTFAITCSLDLTKKCAVLSMLCHIHVARQEKTQVALPGAINVALDLGK